jgi:hypothetical protein
MARTEVADRESRLQIWEVVANILNKQRPEGDNCGPLETGLKEERYEYYNISHFSNEILCRPWYMAEIISSTGSKNLNLCHKIS